MSKLRSDSSINKTGDSKNEPKINSEIESKLINPEEMDKQLLADNERVIDEILRLIEDNTDQTEAARRLAEAQEWVDQKRKGTIFHQHPKGNRKIAMNHHTSNLFKLSRALELSMKTKRYGKDLHLELETHLNERVKVLKRIIARDKS